MGRRKSSTTSHHGETSDPDYVPVPVKDGERSHSIEHVAKRKKKYIKKNQSETEKPNQHENLGKHGKKERTSSRWRQAAIDTRCSPSRLNRLCNLLTTDQVKIVESMGFASIFHIKTPLDRNLCYELVNAIDLSRMCMFVNGEPIQISHDDVGLVFDLPVKGLKIPTSLTKDQESLLEEFVGANDTQLLGMIEQGTTDAVFKRAFILYVLSGFFCPTSHLRPSPRLMGAIIDVDDVHKYNWSQFIFEWLIDQITIYKSSKYKIRNIGGCLFFLMIVYFHRQPLGNMGSASVRPLVAFWDHGRLQTRIRLERKSMKGISYRSKDQPKVVDIKWLNNTYKTQIVRELVVHHLYQFKKLDEAIIAGKYNESLMPKIPSYKANESSAGTDEENEENAIGSMGSDEEADIEQTAERIFMDARIESAPKFSDAGPSNKKGKKIEKMKQKLYTYCTKDPRGNAKVASEVLVNISGHFLDRKDTSSMRPRTWLLNTVVSFASILFNEVEKTQKRSRYCLSTYFMDKITFGMEEFKNGKHNPWESIQLEFTNLLSDITDMGKCKLIFAPVVMDNHWWCYVVDRQNNKLFVLDSMIQAHVGDRLLVDELAVIRFQELLQLLEQRRTPNQVKLDVVHETLPQQDGSHDCGIYTIKFMEMWDGVTRYDGGLTMPMWTRSEIATFRRELLLNWVLDERNEHMVQVLKDAKVDGLLPTCVHEGDATQFIGTPSIHVRDKDLDSIDDSLTDQPHTVEPTYNPPSTTDEQVKTYKRKHRGGANSPPDSDNEVVAKEKPPSTIAGRAKTLPRKRTAGPHNRTPYTERHVK